MQTIEETEASEVMPNLWVGSMSDAIRLIDNPKYLLICVLEDCPPTSSFIHIPILEMDKDGFLTAKIENLDEVATEICLALERGLTVLVFCGAGMERSPLAVTWYVYRTNCMTIEDAFRWVKKHRPIAVSRLDWLPVDWLR